LIERGQRDTKRLHGNKEKRDNRENIKLEGWTMLQAETPRIM
jgi:hypothetical protein